MLIGSTALPRGKRFARCRYFHNLCCWQLYWMFHYFMNVQGEARCRTSVHLRYSPCQTSSSWPSLQPLGDLLLIARDVITEATKRFRIVNRIHSDVDADDIPATRQPTLASRSLNPGVRCTSEYVSGGLRRACISPGLCQYETPHLFALVSVRRPSSTLTLVLLYTRLMKRLSYGSWMLTQNFTLSQRT